MKIKKVDLREEIVKALYGEELSLKCPKCGSYEHIKIKGLKKMHTGGDDWCQKCGHIGEEWRKK